jgi:uncharacterized protein YggE
MKETNMRANRLLQPASFLAIVMAAIIATMTLWTSAAAQPTPIASDSLRTITVNGTGIVSTTPDTASVTLGIRSTMESLKTAQGDVTRRLTGVTETLTEAGIAAEDIKTAQYNITPIPEYDRNGNFKGIQQYEVSVALSVTVRDLDLLGTILDETVSAGVNDVWGISMYVDDTSEATSQARAAAMTDARTRADQFALTEGLLITGVYSINETSAPEPKSTRMDADTGYSLEAGAAEAMPVPISPGSTDIRVDVQVIYIVEQGNG